MCIRYVGTSCAVQHLPCQRCAVPLWRHEIEHPSAAAELHQTRHTSTGSGCPGKTLGCSPQLGMAQCPSRPCWCLGPWDCGSLGPQDHDGLGLLHRTDYPMPNECLQYPKNPQKVQHMQSLQLITMHFIWALYFFDLNVFAGLAVDSLKLWGLGRRGLWWAGRWSKRLATPAEAAIARPEELAH